MFVQDNIKIVNAECISYMQGLESKSFDMILCDLPYGTTACKWDTVIPFDKLWEQYKRLIKPNGAIVLFGREPFTSLLVSSNIKEYKHKWVWNKKQSGIFQNAKFMPLQIEEDIIVFSQKRCNYYPLMRKGKLRKRGGAKEVSGVVGGGFTKGFENYSDMYYPTNIIEMVNPRLNKLHPTQKPVALFEYLIKTYTKEGDKVLDNCLGSGTTARACFKTNRHCLGIEQDKGYYDIACNSIVKLKEDYESSSN